MAFAKTLTTPTGGVFFSACRTSPPIFRPPHLHAWLAHVRGQADASATLPWRFKNSVTNDHDAGPDSGLLGLMLTRMSRSSGWGVRQPFRSGR
jgi:hypothetical protein